MAGRPAIILDGNLSDDLLVWLYFDQPQPRVEVIARHGTDWGALPGQFRSDGGAASHHPRRQPERRPAGLVVFRPAAAAGGGHRAARHRLGRAARPVPIGWRGGQPSSSTAT